MDQNNPTPSTKQQVVEKLKSASNVLITVSDSPSVDQLAACIGLTLLLNKLEKHATAVFSGQVPSTIEFLKPEETLEQTTDSLRDFIIALDRSKADKLRYKPEDNLVKIFITPYRTALSEKDLQFSQGDFNVDAVIALGVVSQEHLDRAIMAQGRILHDAPILGVSCGATATEVGSINWHEPAASSLSEMLVSMSESFQSGLIDAQIATAFLTGIVAETERFSNDKTSPKVMTISAQLMAAGANQQLISTQLSIPMPVPQEVAASVPHDDMPPPATDGSVPLAVDQPAEIGTLPLAPPPAEPEPVPAAEPVPPPALEPTPPPADPTTLSIEHQGLPTTLTDEDVLTPAAADPTKPDEAIKIDEQGNLIAAAVPPTSVSNAPGEPAIRHEKVIQPLSHEEKTPLDNYILNQAAETAAAPEPAAAPAPEPAPPAVIDGLPAPAPADAAPATPILHHDAPPASAEPTAEPPITPPPAEPVQEAESAAPSADAAPGLDQAAAREAVLQAMATPSQPLAALNAQPLNLDAPLETHSTDVPPTAPPPAPPPIMPFANGQNQDVILPPPQANPPAADNPFGLPPANAL